MKISIRTIPHSEQRYDTPGDWLFDAEGNLDVFVSDLGNRIHEWLVAEHEVNEALMCISEGITEKSVSDFDTEFEKLRRERPDLIGDQEPGNMVSAPYFSQHQRATSVEMHSAQVHGVDWRSYSDSFEVLER